jgi:hemolysin activation/secretion protein
MSRDRVLHCGPETHMGKSRADKSARNNRGRLLFGGAMTGLRSAVAGLVAVWGLTSFAQAPATAPAPAPRFDIQAFVIEGNTLFQLYELHALVEPYTGKQKDFGDIQRALEALQAFYVERGYNAVRVLVPEQDIRAGRVHLQVIEARIRTVKVQGNRFFDDDNVRSSLPALQEGRAPNTREIGANVTLANENPIRQLRVVLESTPEVGKVDAVVRVTDDDPWRTTAFFDNTGNPTTGHTRAGIGFLNANFGGVDQVLNLQAITSPTEPDDVVILGAGYRVPLYRTNALFDLYGGYSDVDSGTLQDLFAVSGSGAIAGTRYTQVLPRLGSYEQKAAIGLEWKAFKNDVVLIGTTSTLVPDVTTLPLLLTYTGRDLEPGRDISFYLSYAANNPYGNGDASPEAIEAARAGAKARFQILRVGFSYSRALREDNIFRVALDGQYTQDALIPGEQFGMGGQNSVRGFYERTTAHDIGHRVSFELYGPEIGDQIAPDWKARMLGFIDAARGKDQAPVRLAESGLMSVGVGGRATRGKNLSLRFDFALVVDGTASRSKGEARTHFGISYTF